MPFNGRDLKRWKAEASFKPLFRCSLETQCMFYPSLDWSNRDRRTQSCHDGSGHRHSDGRERQQPHLLQQHVWGRGDRWSGGGYGAGSGKRSTLVSLNDVII